MEKVVIVRQNYQGRPMEGEYSGLVDIMERRLIEAKVEVRVAQTPNDAQNILKEGEVSTLVFISKRMMRSARELKDSHPDVRVVVCTAVLPEPGEYPFALDGLVLVDKWQLLESGQILEAIFSA